MLYNNNQINITSTRSGPAVFNNNFPENPFSFSSYIQSIFYIFQSDQKVLLVHVHTIKNRLYTYTVILALSESVIIIYGPASGYMISGPRFMNTWVVSNHVVRVRPTQRTHPEPPNCNYSTFQQKR